jgi:uncharacterized protein YyaL (SSP411 family)
LLVRQKVSKDKDLPSGNSVAMQNLLRLSRMTADPTLEAKAMDIVTAFALQIGGGAFRLQFFDEWSRFWNRTII